MVGFIENPMGPLYVPTLAMRMGDFSPIPFGGMGPGVPPPSPPVPCPEPGPGAPGVGAERPWGAVTRGLSALPEGAPEAVVDRATDGTLEPGVSSEVDSRDAGSAAGPGVRATSAC